MVAATLLFLLVARTPSAPGQSNASTTFSGRATVVHGTIAGIDVSLS